jgi:hypothetical protein
MKFGLEYRNVRHHDICGEPQEYCNIWVPEIGRYFKSGAPLRIPTINILYGILYDRTDIFVTGEPNRWHS